MNGSLTVNERDIRLSRIKKSTVSEQPIRLVIRDFKIQRRGRQGERQKNNWLN